MEFLKVKNTDIEKLTDRQLTELLSILLYSETEKFGITSNSVSVALNITVPDGGEDGRIKWEGGVEETDWLPKRYSLFQCKATDMPPSRCHDEILTMDSELKPMVEHVFENGGAYVLFHNRTLNERQQQERIDKFREAVSNSSYDSSGVSPNIYIYDASKIAAWTNGSISAVVAVWEWVGHLLPYGAKTWRDWSGYQDNSYKYVLDDSIKLNIEQLRRHFKGIKKVARIVGLSGLGKTRLAFEAFRPPEKLEDVDQQIRSSQVIYIDNAIGQNNLPAVIATWRTQELRGTIIVDNCDPDLHTRLAAEVEHSESQLNLLTLDFNPERPNFEHPYIELKRVTNEVIKGIIKQEYSEIKTEDIDRIVDFAQGFPKIAVLLAKARLNQDNEIGSLRDDTLVNRLLWGRSDRDTLKYQVISSCALFDHLGFSREFSEQRLFTATKICGIDDDEFYEACQYFIDRGILDVRGRFIRVTPLPLAIRLAAEWWGKCSPEKAFKIVTANMPNGMSEALCDQMAKLHFLPKAQELTSSLCGELAPFGQAEVLNSEKGSRLFRSLVEVNPKATANTLYRVFGNMSIEGLLKVGPGRRNLIWALEKLCFWNETFETATKILILFAAAENESWANNATSQFLQLFHIVLSGTQAPPEKRIRIIDYALESEIPQVKILGIEALEHALQSHHLTRMVGVEKQGSRPIQQEWTPKNWNEVLEYWKDVLQHLDHIAINGEKNYNQACKVIAGSIRELVQYGIMEDLENTIRSVVQKRGAFWPEALESIKDVIRFEGSNMQPDELKRLQKWEEWVQPSGFLGRLKLIISIPEWDYKEKEDTGSYLDIAKENAIEFANVTVKNHFDELLSNLQVLLVGEQRQGYTYGYEICSLIKETEGLLNKVFLALNELVKSKTKNINLKFLGGILAQIQTINSELVKNALNKISNSAELCQFIVELTSYIHITETDLDRIKDLLIKNKINVNSLNLLAYGRVLSHLDPDEIKNFISELTKFGYDGITVGWHILFMYTHGDEVKFEAVYASFIEMLQNQNVLIGESIAKHEINKIIEKILYLEREFATTLCKEIKNLIIVRLDYIQIQNLRVYISTLMKAAAWQYGWGTFSEALLSENKIVVYNTIDLLKPNDNNKGTWLLERVPNEVLESWCEENKNGADLLSEIVPVKLEENNGELKINSIINYLLTVHGNKDRVLQNISIRLHSFGCSGSSVPYYQKLISFFRFLEQHKLSKVRMWALSSIEEISKVIEQEKLREEESDMGYFDT